MSFWVCVFGVSLEGFLVHDVKFFSFWWRKVVFPLFCVAVMVVDEGVHNHKSPSFVIFA